MATDYTTSPVTHTGQFIYAAGCGFIAFVIRKWGGYPEGVSYSILLMNIVTPLIDKGNASRVFRKEGGKMKDVIRCGGILCAITLIMGALLGAVNGVTAPVIEKLSEKSRIEAMAAVTDGEITSQGDEIAGGETSVKSVTVLETKNGTAYAVSAAPKGYGGEISMMVGINADGEVTGVTIMDMSETAGLGANAKKETFLDQFKGKDPKIQALTGATITTNRRKKRCFGRKSSG